MEFNKQILEYSQEINKFLNDAVIIQDVPERRLLESMKYSLMSGGKRLRPILLLCTYKLFKEDYLEAVPFAIAMEMVHSFSLIHDDLPAIDNDDFRHNKPTNHKMFDEGTAVLAGDGLLNGAYEVISESLLDINNLENKVRAYNEFSKAVSRMIAGEYVDIDCEGKNISLGLLKYMHQNKTGALISASIRIGAILAGASEEDINKLSLYADKVGLAFQIKDDILSEVGNEKIMGKPAGKDKEMNKCSFVTVYGLEKTNEVLDNLVKEAIEIVKGFGTKSKFFEDFAVFIQNREK